MLAAFDKISGKYIDNEQSFKNSIDFVTKYENHKIREANKKPWLMKVDNNLVITDQEKVNALAARPIPWSAKKEVESITNIDEVISFLKKVYK